MKSLQATPTPPAMSPLGPAIEPDGPLVRACRLGGLDDPGAVRRVDVAELIGRVGRDGVAAVGASVRVVTDGHAARLTGFLIGVVSFHGLGLKHMVVSLPFVAS